MNIFRGRRAWLTFYGIAAAFVFVATTVVWILYETQSRIVEVDKKRAAAQTEIDLIAQGLQNAVIRNSNSLETFAAFVALQPDLSKEAFRAYSRRTFMKYPEFELVALAPDLVISDVFPLEGNQAAIGLDYNQNEAQLAAVKRAIDAKQVIIAGPVDLVQGGRALIARKAVEVSDFAAFRTRLWGIVSLVLDLDVILQQAGAKDSGLNWAIRGKDGLGMDGGMIRGQPLVFTQDPVMATVNLPVGSWKIAAIPSTGWAIPASVFATARVGFAVSGLLLVLLIWGVMRLVQLRMRADGQLMTAMNSIDDGFAFYDDDDRLILCNDKYRELYARSAKAIVPGKTFEEIVRYGLKHGQYAEAVGREEEFLKERMAAHQSGNVNVEQQLEDGRWLKIKEAQTPDGGLVGFCVDITELRNARDGAEAANRAKSEFLDVMSHELRTPLTVVLGGTPFLCQPELMPATKKLFNALEERGEEAADIKADAEAMLSTMKSLAGKVDRSAKHLLTLINDVLDYSKIEDGRLNMKLQTLSFADVIDQVIEEFAPKAEQKSLYLEAEVGDHFVKADEIRLRQVLVNIVSNAIKFTDEGGIEISAIDLGAFIQVTVKDTGVGIPEDRLESVFDKFSQVDSSSSRHAGGTGLGMAISKKIVEMQGGRIFVDSTLGEGTTFTFTLKRAKAPMGTGEVEEASALRA